MSVACVVLGAGAGRRFGGNKADALLPDGASFLATIAQAAMQAGVCPILVVLRPGQTAPPGTIAVINPDPASEQIESFRLGLRQLADTPVDGTLMWPVDCPLVRSETIVALLGSATARGAVIVVPVHAGRRGHPTYFARSTWPDLMAAREGGAREVLRRRKPEVAEVAVDDPAVLHDIDSRVDLARATTETTD